MVGGQSDLSCWRSGKEEQGRLRDLTDQASHLELPHPLTQESGVIEPLPLTKVMGLDGLTGEPAA